jgi:maleylpyruvate isomerase
MTSLTLYNYFRSSASFRVRIALNLKGLAYDYASVNLVREGGDQFSPSYRAINSDALVPALVDDGQVLTQSLAIMEYLDETHPEPPLLPRGALERARVRALALSIACEIHPLNNLRVLRYLKNTLGISDEARDAWYRHWVELGLGAMESQLVGSAATGRFCHGDSPTLADCCLVPQIYNGQRLKCDFSHVPTVVAIHQNCMQLEAFQRAAPAIQPDAE